MPQKAKAKKTASKTKKTEKEKVVPKSVLKKEKKASLSTDPYKGVRDFYPEDMFIQKYLFMMMRQIVESFGYVEYDASPLESSDLYKAKSSEEIVTEQTYTFTDRGSREVTLRPEMTPTVARLVAGKLRELAMPIRWYSLPNVFRYEKPQRGRLREHYQLNVDIFGVDSREADVEIINIASTLLNSLGAENSDFEIKINNRKLIKALFDSFEINDQDAKKLSRLLDKKDKIAKDAFEAGIKEILGDQTNEFLNAISDNENILRRVGENHPAAKALVEVINRSLALGIDNLYFDPSLMRGFDYYTGFVFEIFDTNPENNRSLFGGGRYDDLLEIFDKDKMPAVGFGMGDVTLKDFLESRDLLPKYRSAADLYICRAGDKHYTEIISLANSLRNKDVNVEVDISGKKKIGDQIKLADKKKIPFIICVGDDELKTKEFKLKHLVSSKEELVPEIRLADTILNWVK